jgi:hypothetical protein
MRYRSLCFFALAALTSSVSAQMSAASHFDASVEGWIGDT